MWWKLALGASWKPKLRDSRATGLASQRQVLNVPSTWTWGVRVKEPMSAISDWRLEPWDIWLASLGSHAMLTRRSELVTFGYTHARRETLANLLCMRSHCPDLPGTPSRTRVQVIQEVECYGTPTQFAFVCGPGCEYPPVVIRRRMANIVE